MDSDEHDIMNFEDSLQIKHAKYGAFYPAATEKGLASESSETVHKERVDQKSIRKKRQRKRRKGKRADVDTEEIKKTNQDTPCRSPGDGCNEEVTTRVTNGCDRNVQKSSELDCDSHKCTFDEEIQKLAPRGNFEQTIFNPGSSLEMICLEKSKKECGTNCKSCEAVSSETFHLNEITVDSKNHDKSAFALFELAPQDVIIIESQNGEKKTLDPSEVVFVLSETDDDFDGAEVKADGDGMIMSPNVKNFVSTNFTTNAKGVDVLSEKDEDGKWGDNNGDEERVNCDKRAELEQAQPDFHKMCANGKNFVVKDTNDGTGAILDVKKTDKSIVSLTKFTEITMEKGDTENASDVDIVNPMLYFELSVSEEQASLAEDYFDDSSREVTAEGMGICGIGDLEDIEHSLKKNELYSDEDISVEKIGHADKIIDLKWEAHKEACEALKAFLDAEDSGAYETQSDQFDGSGLEKIIIDVLAIDVENCIQKESFKCPVSKKLVNCNEYNSYSSECVFPHINVDLIAEESNEKDVSFSNESETEDCEPGKFKRVSSEQFESVEKENEAYTAMENKCEDSFLNDVSIEISGFSGKAACERKYLGECDDNFAIIVRGYCDEENIKSVNFPFPTTSDITKSFDSRRKEQEYAHGGLSFIGTVDIENNECISKTLRTNLTKTVEVEYSSGKHRQESIFLNLKNAGLGRRDEEGEFKSASESDPEVFEEAWQDSGFLVKDSDKATVEQSKITDEKHSMKDTLPFIVKETSQALLEDQLEKVTEDADDDCTDTEEDVGGYLVYLQDASGECSEASQMTQVETNLLQRIKILEGKNSQLSTRNQELVLENYALRVRATQAELRLQTEMDLRRVDVESRENGFLMKGFNRPQCTLM